MGVTETSVYKTLTPRQYAREYGPSEALIGCQLVKVRVYNVRLAKGGRTHKQDDVTSRTVCGLTITETAVGGGTVTCQSCKRGLTHD